MPHSHTEKCIRAGLLICGYGLSSTSRVISLDFLRIADELSAYLAQRNIPHALTGGLAVSAYGYDRTTKDIDFIVRPEDKERLKAALGHLTTSHMNDGPRNVSKGQFHQANVDLLHLRKNEKALREGLGTGGIPIVSLGALMYLKLLSSRQKDYADVIELLKANSEAYVKAIGFLSVEQLSGETRQKLVRKLERAKTKAAEEKRREP